MTRSRIQYWPLIACCALAGGCTTVRIEGAQPRVERHFGVLRIAPDQNAEALVIRSRGFGLVPTTQGLTVGYRAETAAYLFDPTQCRVVLFPESKAEVASFLATLEQQGTSTANICDISPKEKP